MGSDWIYYTSVRPLKKRSDGEDGNTEYKLEFNKSFNNFLEDCKLSLNNLDDNLRTAPVYIYEILTDKENDPINRDSDYHIRFLKSVFLTNPKFKRELIDYYNPAGYFIKGPTKVNEDKWIIEFSQKIRNY